MKDTWIIFSSERAPSGPRRWLQIACSTKRKARQLTNKRGVLQYLAAHNISNYWTFQPADRFWTLQVIETSMFVLLAGVVFSAAILLLRRRSA